MCYGNLNTNYYFGFVVGMETTVSTRGKCEQRQSFISSNYIGVFHTDCVMDSRFFNFVNN